MVYLLGVAAAALLAVGFVIQHHAAEEEPPSLRLSYRLLVHLAARRKWLLGIAAMIAGQIAGAAALSRGPVALVEPLLAANLLFALPLTALYHRRRLRAVDVAGAFVLIAGLALFVSTGRPHGGSPHRTNATAWAAAFGALAVALVVLLVAQRRRSATATAILLGIGAGLVFGMQDTLTQGVDRVASHGISAFFSSWMPYVLLAAGATGLLLAQSAFEAAPLSASLPAITAAEPLAGIALGIGLYRERVSTSPLALAGETLGLAAVVCGIVIVGRSPVVTGQHRWRSG
ncbi:MAG TPA: DMT family transporter [Mycobacterium sp.]|nr:DMT family transporter [Mycobacterium sp.]